MNNIKDYASDTSSSDSEEDVQPPKKKLQKLPPPPSILQDQYYKSSNYHKESAKIPESMRFNKNPIKANAKHFYCSIEFTPTAKQCSSLDFLIESLNFAVKQSPKLKNVAEFKPCYRSPLKYIIPLHVSLTPNYSVPLRHSSILMDNLTSKLKDFKAASTDSNLIKFDSVTIYPNLRWTCLYPALNLTAESKSNISQITQLITDSIRETLGPDEEITTFDSLEWDDSKLHISFAEAEYILKDLKELEELQNELKESIEIDEDEVSWRFKEIKVLNGDRTRGCIEIGDFVKLM